MGDIWTFFRTHVKKAICKYQVQHDGEEYATAYFEDILCKAVQDMPPRKAREKIGGDMNLL
jgi:hypothetical protein